jgi:hypothetical protein
MQDGPGRAANATEHHCRAGIAHDARRGTRLLRQPAQSRHRRPGERGHRHAGERGRHRQHKHGHGHACEQTSRALAASYDGQSWTIASVPALAHGSSEFNAVSCPSANYCVAVGEGGGPGGTTFSNAALTGFWNGQSWTLVGAS